MRQDCNRDDLSSTTPPWQACRCVFVMAYDVYLVASSYAPHALLPTLSCLRRHPCISPIRAPRLAPNHSLPTLLHSCLVRRQLARDGRLGRTWLAAHFSCSIGDVNSGGFCAVQLQRHPGRGSKANPRGCASPAAGLGAQCSF